MRVRFGREIVDSGTTVSVNDASRPIRVTIPNVEVYPVIVVLSTTHRVLYEKEVDPGTTVTIPFDASDHADETLTIDIMDDDLDVLDSFLFSVAGDKGSWVEIPGESSDEPPAKYCRCVLQVEATGDGKYNPYAVCHKTVPTDQVECGQYYRFEQLPDKELRAYARLEDIDIPDPYDRDELIDRIYDAKSE